MIHRSSLVIAIVLAASASGCSTFFNATAPGPQPNVHYVVGSKAGLIGPEAKVWLCPEGAGDPAECREVQVNEK